MSTLLDLDHRRRALTGRDRSILVEAGAGSGKTAIMAGRVALLLAEGEPPGSIAAITFTELAAAELADRVQRFVLELLDGVVDPALAPALPHGPDASQLAQLERAVANLDDLTCTTIHGFARDLVRPYPVEADVDPGAQVLDADAADLAFDDAFDGWLTERLGGTSPHPDDVVAALVMAEPTQQVTWLRKLAALVRDHPEARRPTTHDVAQRLREAVAAARACRDVVDGSTIPAPDDAIAIADAWGALADAWHGGDGASDAPRTDVAHLLALVRHKPAGLFTDKGTVRAYRLKGAWAAAAASVGASRAAANQVVADAIARRDDAAAAIDALFGAIADHCLARALVAVQDVRARYQAHKREAAQMDFDDLLATAVRLLRDHAPVHAALAERYRHVLVDEFQDTDPVQAEIVWRLTGAPADPASDWRSWPARAGARFVVGDPKQSIYRFRRADVATYLALRDGMAGSDGGERLSITVNFRSRAGILDAANRTFADPLSATDQPGYEPLTAHRLDAGVAVRALHVPAPPGADPTARLKAGEARRAEAAAVADLCARLIRGEDDLLDGPVPAGHIALLAPTGTDLALYERALEERGVAVASQAGKGFFRRQEIQDLVALARVLADGRDRTALGALLRGPLIGATDEELLDVAEALQAAAAGPLSVFTEPELVPAAVVRQALERLGPLARRGRATTPYALLSDALERLEVRAVLIDRHRGHADRPLANVAVFLERARPYAARGLRAFAQDVWREWQDETRTGEGRPDEEREAVTLITVHSAKGLEWPVVIPVNAFGTPRRATAPVIDRRTDAIEANLLGTGTSGLADALEAEERALAAERVRLWYVAATRARDLFVLPIPEFGIVDRAWHHIVPWVLPDEAPIRPRDTTRPLPRPTPPDGGLDQATYEAEAQRIAESRPRVQRVVPSRHEAHDAEAGGDAASPDWGVDLDPVLDDPDDVSGALVVEPSAAWVQGAGATRGVLLHKLLEELVTGELADTDDAVRSRARDLLDQLAGPVRPDPDEVAAAARRAWTLPEVAALHGRLVAELDVAGSATIDGVEFLTAGIADAVAFAPDGAAQVVVDWKSDVSPRPATIDGYRAQLRAYLRLLGAREGLLVFATGGAVVRVGGVGAS